MTKKKSILSTLIFALAISSAFADHSELTPADNNSPNTPSLRLPKNSNRSPFFRWGHFDTGLVLGSINRFEERGTLVHTWELDINVGDAGRSSTSSSADTYYSMPFAYSTVNRSAYDLISKTPINVPAVFKYQWNLITFRFRQETRYNIVDVFPSYIGKSPREANLPLEWAANSRLFLKYKKNVRSSGRIIKVQRAGRLWTGCLVTLHKKGDKKITKTYEERVAQTEFNQYKETGSLGYSTADYIDTDMNIERYVINEEGCRYAEAILPFAAQVEITSDQSYTQAFDYPDQIVRIVVQ